MLGTENSGETSEKSATITSLWKEQPIRDQQYLNWIRSLPCVLCQNHPPSDPHHIPKQGHSGKGTKTDDTRAIPLCHYHHIEYHQYGRLTFSIANNIEYESVILRLNKIYYGSEDEVPS